jgi:hypothetical protein
MLRTSRYTLDLDLRAGWHTPRLPPVTLGVDVHRPSVCVRPTPYVLRHVHQRRARIGSRGRLLWAHVPAMGLRTVKGYQRVRGRHGQDPGAAS